MEGVLSRLECLSAKYWLVKQSLYHNPHTILSLLQWLGINFGWYAQGVANNNPAFSISGATFQL